MDFHYRKPLFNHELFPMTASELEFNLNRAMIAVYFYADSERGINPSQQLTYAHIAAIHRQQLSTLPKDTLAEIDREMIRFSAYSITDRIFEIKDAKASIDGDIMLKEDNENSLIYNKLLSIHPTLSKEDFMNDLDNVEFFNSINRSPAYQKNYLEVVRSKYAEVPDEMKEGLWLVHGF